MTCTQFSLFCDALLNSCILYAESSKTTDDEVSEMVSRTHKVLLQEIENSKSRNDYIHNFNCYVDLVNNNPILSIPHKVDESVADMMIMTRDRQALERLSHPTGYDWYINQVTYQEKRNEMVKWYWRKTGKTFDWDNLQTFNEKMQWIKLHPTKEQTVLADKVRCRTYLMDKYRLPKALFSNILKVWTSVDDITQEDIDALPERFVIKTNHGVGSHIIVNDGNKPSLHEIKEHFRKVWSTSFASIAPYEEVYDYIVKLIFVEEYLEDATDDEIRDYKVMCIGGKAQFIWVDKDRYTDHKRNVYSTDWSKLDFEIEYSSFDEELDKPVYLDEMISIAEMISAEQAQLRVDFFITNDGRLILGECTSTTESGICRWFPDEKNVEYGKMLNI